MKDSSLRIAQCLLIVASALAGVLAYQALTGSSVMGCGASGGCQTVLQSRWARVYSLPVGLLGGGIYVGLLLLTMTRVSRPVQLLTQFACFIVLLGAFWFVGVQVFLLQSYCVYCCAAHGVASVAALLLLRLFWHREGGILMAGSAVLLVGGMVAAQALQPERNHSETVSVAQSTDSDASEAGPYLITPTRLAIDQGLGPAYLGGTTRLEHSPLPQLTLNSRGQKRNPEPPVVLVFLFDWSCSHCLAFYDTLFQLSLRNESLGLKQSYEITLLPVSFNDQAAACQRLMQHAFSHSEASYLILAQELVAGALRPEEKEMQAFMQTTLPELKVSTVDKPPGERESLLAALAQRQAEHNKAVLGQGILPQLTSLKSVLSGVPSDEALKGFLEKAAAEQEEYLANPPLIFPTAWDAPGASSAETAIRAAGTPPPARNSSEIQFDQVKVTTEAILPGGVAKGVFYFTNTGKDPLEVYGVQTGCGCTTAHKWKQTLQPGERGQISITYDSAGKSPIGPHRRKLWITTSARNFLKGNRRAEQYGHEVTLIIPLLMEDE